MRIQIVKPVDVRFEGVVKTLATRAELNLPDDKAKKLIDAGYAVLYKSTHADYGALIADFGERDPGGNCWPWIQSHYPELWRRHREAFKDGDFTAARETFAQMIEAWESRDVQPALLAAPG